MGKFLVTKIVRSPKQTVLTLVIYLLCVALAVSIGMGICYAYFTDKVDGTGSVTSGILNIRYIEDSTSTVEANNLVVFNTRDNETNLLTSGSSTLMPGDKLNVKGAIENVENIDCYSVFKVEVEKTYNDGSKDITYSDISWFNLDGERITQNNNGRYTIPASELNVGDIKEVDILFELGAEEINNSYAGKNVVVTLTLCAYQFEALERETYETDSGSAYLYDSIALQTTHKLIGNEIDVWGENTVASTSLSGEGTEANPYLISSVADLLYFGTIYTSTDDLLQTPTTYYKLTKNLDLNNKVWTPIMFCGYLDGNGYKIININVNSGIFWEDYGYFLGGLFSMISGEIKNLQILNINIDIECEDIAILYAFGGLAGLSTAEIKNCAIIGTNNINITFETTGNYFYLAGGFAGMCEDVSDSYAVLDINVTGSTPHEDTTIYIGGIGGMSGNITNCYFIGNLNYTTQSVCRCYLGSISGVLNNSLAQNCFSISSGSIYWEDVVIVHHGESSAPDEEETKTLISTYLANCAYIYPSNGTEFTKVGSNQTEMQLTANNMKDVATLRDAMGFSYEHWINDGTNYPTLRVFVK